MPLQGEGQKLLQGRDFSAVELHLCPPFYSTFNLLHMSEAVFVLLMTLYALTPLSLLAFSVSAKKARNRKLAKFCFYAWLVIITLFTVQVASAQGVVRKGNTFEQVSKKENASTAQKTPFTYKDSKGKVYPIFITKNGRCFVMKVSSKTNKEYKMYMKEEISREICKEMKITYKEK